MRRALSSPFAHRAIARAGARPGARMFATEAPSEIEVPKDDFQTFEAEDSDLTALIGSRVFTDDDLKARVEPTIYKQWKQCIKDGTAPKKQVREPVAQALKQWASERGAVSFAHWASPLRGSTNLLKHDAMVELDFGAPTADKPVRSHF